MNKREKIRALKIAVERLIEASRLSKTMRGAAKYETALAQAVSAFFKAQGQHIAVEYRRRNPETVTEALREADGDMEDEIRRKAEEEAAALVDSTPEQLMLPLVYAADKEILAAFVAAAEAQLANLKAGTAEEIGAIAFDVEHPEAIAFMKDKGAALVKQINETTRDRMRALLLDSISKGKSQDWIAKKIIEQFDGMAILKPQKHILTRANLIASCEIGNAYQEGNLQAAQQLQASSGLAIEKAWLTCQDDRVDPHCLANEEQGWIDLDSAFQSSHMRPLAHPACRCSLLQRRKGAEHTQDRTRKPS